MEIENAKILKLTLNKAAFNITGTKEKEYELRNFSQWIASRLYHKNGSFRMYDFVELKNGYSKQSPRKLFNYLGFATIKSDTTYQFSNGLIFRVKKGDFIIYLGTQHI